MCLLSSGWGLFILLDRHICPSILTESRYKIHYYIVYFGKLAQPGHYVHIDYLRSQFPSLHPFRSLPLSPFPLSPPPLSLQS